MKEIIIVAGNSKADVYRLRYRLRAGNYNSIPCKSAEQILEELEILPTCDAFVPLVVMAPDILRDISEDIICRLTTCTPSIPFLLLNETDTETDLTERFERISENRVQFGRHQNLELADILKGSGVEIICN